VKYLLGAPLLGRLLTLPTNILMGMEGLAKEQLYGLLQKFVNYVLKKFYKTAL
jgi:hypothetical protein